jgi:predicted nucleotidyltransferase
MNTHPDFVELLRLLEENGVEYMIVGGYAVAYHGYPRFTKDLDIFFRVTEENITRIRTTLVAFGFREEDLPPNAFSAAGNVLTFGVAPVRVDQLNEIDGITYETAKDQIVRGTYGGVEVTFIGFDDLVRNKKSTSRTKDKGDVEELIKTRDANGA